MSYVSADPVTLMSLWQMGMLYGAHGKPPKVDHGAYPEDLKESGALFSR